MQFSENTEYNAGFHVKCDLFQNITVIVENIILIPYTKNINIINIPKKPNLQISKIYRQYRFKIKLNNVLQFALTLFYTPTALQNSNTEFVPLPRNDCITLQKQSTKPLSDVDVWNQLICVDQSKYVNFMD